MNRKTYGLMVVSAFLYAIPFLQSDYLWWMIVAFPIPLLYAASIHPLSFIHGAVWGFIAFALHAYGGIIVIVRMSHEHWFMGCLLGLSVLMYQALCAGSLFWLGNQITVLCAIQSRLAKIVVYAGVLAVFIVWVDSYCLSIFDVSEGYCLMHPLILLTQYPPLLALVTLVGKQVMAILFLLFPVAVTVLALYRNGWACLLLFCSLVTWVVSLLLYAFSPKPVVPLWIDKIGVIQCMTKNKGSYPKSMVHVTRQRLAAFVDRNPHVECIIFPESAFDSECFSYTPDLLTTWNRQALGKPIHLVFGAFRRCNGYYYNSLYWLYDGVLQQYFDKRHAMILSERLPFLFSFGSFRSIYFNNESEITQGHISRPKLTFAEFGEFVPYVCSELFFNEKPDDGYDTIPIIVIVNDSMFLSSHGNGYMRKLLVLVARFKAIMWERDVVYASYGYGLLIDKHGGMRDLIR